MRRAARAALASLLAAGCAIGPNYHRPEVASPEQFREGPAVEAASIADLPWWEVFQDDVLIGLIQEAIEKNYDLQVAAQRVEEARAFVGVERADLLPQAGYEGDAARGKNAFLGSPSPEFGTAKTFFAALNLAWEIDIWGRIRRSTEAARADLFATEAFRRGVWLTLVSDVAQTYFELRELDLELEIANRTVESFQETLSLFERQFRGGVASKLDALRAEAALAQAAATIPIIESRIVDRENRLSLLLGRPPGPIPRGRVLEEQYDPPEIPVGVPASLLDRRPDLVEAEQTLAAANARVGVAIADFLPRIGLTALYGSASSDLSNLLEKGTNVWSIGGQVTGPIFQGGRLIYNYEGRKAQWEQAKGSYEQSVLSALGEVSNALVTRQKVLESRDQLARQVGALQESVRIARIRYVGGLATYFEVLEAQQQLYPAEISLSQRQLDRLLALVNLYRALGGGWWIDPATPSGPPAPGAVPAPNP